MPTIDAHHHFWNYTTTEFGWLDDSMRAIRRDFLPADLEKEIGEADVDGVISVQARTSVEETRWLLDLARSQAFIKGVVGWLPLADPTVRRILEAFASETKFRSVREVCQGQPAGYMLREDFNAGLGLLPEFGLAYDILIFAHQLEESIHLVDQHPNQIFILDHIAKPRIGENILEPWNQQIRELARRGNVYCKVSGMVTEASFDHWTEAQLRPYFETVLDAFGPQRLLFGSDWPVCLVACPYGRWLKTVRQWAVTLSADERDHLFYKTAEKAYGVRL